MKKLNLIRNTIINNHFEATYDVDYQVSNRIIGAARRKYVTVDEGAALYGFGIHGFEKLAKDSGARRTIGRKVLVITQKLDDYIETMFTE